MLISEAKRIGMIPVEYHKLIANECPFCEEERDISMNRKSLTCVNPYCSNKTIYRLEGMLKSFGIVGIGVDYAERLLDSIDSYRLSRLNHNISDPLLDKFVVDGYISPMEVFYLPYDRYPSSATYSFKLQKYRDIQKVLETEFYFSDIVSKMELPNVKGIAHKAFFGIRDMKDFISETCNLETVTRFYSKRIGDGEKCSNFVWATNTFIRDFILAGKIFKFKAPYSKEMVIAITQPIVNCGHYSRDNFGRYLNKLGSGKINVRIGKALESAEFIIADSKATSPTYLAGLERQRIEDAKGSGKRIFVDSKEFMEIFNRRLEEM